MTAVAPRMHHTDSGGLGLTKRGLEITARPAGIDEDGNRTIRNLAFEGRRRVWGEVDMTLVPLKVPTVFGVQTSHGLDQ
jgi:hypothetical protein